MSDYESVAIHEHRHINRRGMVSGQGIAVSAPRSFVVGRSGRAWLYDPVNGNQAYCTDQADWLKAGRGFGGSTLHIPLTGSAQEAYFAACEAREHQLCKPVGNHSVFPLHGGWHSNASALLSDAGVDLTNHYTTWGGFSLYHHHSPRELMGIYCGLIRWDKEPVVGLFDRIKKSAIAWATEHNRPVFCYSESEGGASGGMEWPTDWTTDLNRRTQWCRTMADDDRCVLVGECQWCSLEGRKR